MVELAQGSNNLSLHKPEEVGLARSRLIWVMKPLGFLVLVLWVLHPGVSDRAEIGTMLLLGFLLGAAYGLVHYGAQLRQYLTLRPLAARQQSNRIPAEYYWGEINQVLYDNNAR
ncbi:MAG: hypothetical protein INF43_00315 [Alphaproteobacteria bacterium]|jgi:hypothetical protein|nr:hypothetical protein [Alphaproteobacteria bacterium]